MNKQLMLALRTAEWRMGDMFADLLHDRCTQAKREDLAGVLSVLIPLLTNGARIVIDTGQCVEDPALDVNPALAGHGVDEDVPPHKR
ncbi:hypothetical protein [Kutzneria sp. 744]|uniref:hypothetical protein n=1 Tax=Kutzneria sp. (strain 744) TaxID=345341 RepID=UPI0005B836A0|nr:hypothetical protein [Kutzneria sp. 744]